MTDKQFSEYLDDRFEHQRSWHRKKSAKYKKWHHAMLIVSTVLAGASPVVTALVEVKAVPVALAAVVSIVSTLHGASRFKELWIRYRALAEALQREQYWYKAELHYYQDKTSDEQRSVFVDRVESLLFREHEIWVEGLSRQELHTSS